MAQDVKLDNFSITEMETTKSYADSSSADSPLLRRPEGAKVLSSKVFDSFRSGPPRKVAEPLVGENGRVFDAQAAAFNTANSPLVRKLKGRHLQMIAIGGSIGTGLFIGSGEALATGGPASLLIAFILIGGVLFCTVQALGEMAVTFPVAGSFSAYATRFIDPAWGFASGWNYAMQWLFVMPLEIMAASIVLEFWSLPIPGWASITVFLTLIISINLFGVKIYGEAEYCFSIMKVTAVIGFIILGVVINCAGTPDSGYIGGKYWADPGAFHGGFKGFANILVTAAFSFAGTELVGLAAAETQNPSRALPTAIKQVFWRIAVFYVISIAIVGLLVPYTNPRLLGRNDVDSKSSPFIIAITDAGIQGLDSVMNAVVMIAVLSVANSSMYGATRTMQALAEQGQAPRILAYVDREGRPLVSILIASLVGLLSYLYVSPIQGPAFTWLLALSGLSSIFTWLSICYAHIQFRKAWVLQGNLLTDLIYRSPIGTKGSWVGLVSLLLILAAQFWVAVAPAGSSNVRGVGERFANFFEAYLAMPVVLLFYVAYKVWYRTRWVRVNEIDLRTGRNEFESMEGTTIWGRLPTEGR
ncbi:Amino acid transporter-like protein [Venustampulla echinocandica]|uniref:Amino acid transporter-like protein n=1 Tax=Venustampulla echinocandica TaxID=2656787 RepID=A0A370U033_9HELO|nr:Amino acid transporter-like protein [Venustampulla echinocandica]RDL41140.1 Amino acid transporter-like protein [Venustampulla echinocandica]